MNHSLLLPRKIVFLIISAVLRQNRPFDESFEREITALKGKDTLSARDRAFVRMLSTTVLRRLGQIDDMIGRCIKKSLPKRAEKAQDILRIGTAQILFMNTPPHAAVDTSVRLAESFEMGAYKGLINAVLRKIVNEGEIVLKKQDAPRLNTPEWLWQGWKLEYGEAICRKIAAANLEEPAVDITVKKDVEKWAEKLSAKIMPTGSLRLENAGMISELEGYEEGEWWVQDISASLPVKTLGNIKGFKIADICAAPGGKTAQLLSGGAVVTAIDRSEKRNEILKRNLSRLGFNAEVITDDVNEWWEKTVKKNPNIACFDAVIIDAPCSATGTIRKSPDIPILKTSKDIAKLALLQRKLLETAAKMVKVGGTVIYSVCSLEREEGEDCIEAVLSKKENILEVLPFKKDEIKNINEIDENIITPEGFIQTLPFYMGGADGFFCARMKRKV